MKRLLKMLSFLIVTQAVGTSLAAVLPLRNQWKQACRDLAAGRAAVSLERFREFNHWYGEEPDVRDPGFREGWIRLWGLAALEAGALGEAAGLLERWLEENPDQERYRAFLRFQLIGIHQAMGSTGALNSHREQFLEAYPNLPECALVRWNWADEAIQAGNHELAERQLRSVISLESLPAPGKSLARAALALVEMARGADESAMRLLMELPGRQNRLIRFWQALAAPALAQQLLAAGKPEEALKASGWFEFPRELAHEVGTLQLRLRATPGSGGPTAIREGIWRAHWSTRLERLRWSLTRQSEEMDPAASLYALRLQALLGAKRSKQASILGEAILLSPRQTHPGLRAAAYKSVIEAAIALKQWDKAEAFSSQFLQRHPDDPALPDILFLTARTAAARNDWNSALSQMEMLLQAFPENRSRPSWQMLQADWLLQSGQPEEAMARYSSIKPQCPLSWTAFIDFQQGRCQEALGNWDKAAALYASVKEHETAVASLREFAATSLLKLHLRTMNTEAFVSVLEDYRRKWQEGIQRAMVENIAGMFHQRSGDLALAISTFSAVASGAVPEAEFARNQLSQLYREIHDMENLHKHALAWIESGLLSGTQIPETPFADCLLYQENRLEPALPDPLVASLMDTLFGRTSRLPVDPCLDILGRNWPHYRDFIAGKPDSLGQWLQSVIEDARKEANWPAFAAFQLYAARLLDARGREDSADTRRIEVLQEAGHLRLGENTDFVLCLTADSYDFPDAADKLTTFIAAYPDSPHLPVAVVRSARRERLSGNPATARKRLGEVVRNWPDADVFTEAALLYSTWAMTDDLHGEAATTLAILLDTPGLTASETAEALLLRARCDFHSGNVDRGFLSCLRLLTLYPDLNDTTAPALVLLKEQLGKLPDGKELDQIEEKLRHGLQPQHVAQLDFNEA